MISGVIEIDLKRKLFSLYSVLGILKIVEKVLLEVVFFYRLLLFGVIRINYCC